MFMYPLPSIYERSVKWRKAINEMSGNIPGGNFLGGNFPEVAFQGGDWWVEIFRGEIFQGEIFLELWKVYKLL